jgi:ABC-type uncharacterized transport system involved in gliding motility auxiliary subunit
MKTIGNIAGGIGLLLLLTSPITLFVTSGSAVVFGVKLALGIVCLVLWAFTNGERLSNWARSVFFYSSSVLLGVLFISLLFVANYFAQRSNKTWDLTNKKIFSLSDQTEKTLANLGDGIKVIGFVWKNCSININPKIQSLHLNSKTPERRLI